MSFLSRTVLAPLVPVLAPLVPVIGQRAVLGLSGYVINNIGFVFAAVYLYRLSVVILKDQEAAVRASILFCFNSASIFYSSIYSETLFVLFSVGGLYHLISGKDVIAVLWFALSGFSRFNGVLNAGYFCFQTMHQAYDAVFLRKRPFAVVGGALLCICIFVPFIAFQAYGYNKLCLGHLPSDMRPWCNARVPLLYNYIQSHYWYVIFNHQCLFIRLIPFFQV
nr:GPI mannosyltransferase 2-like isoform X1 [Malus domestica]XP_028955101.1 GPI mannosyltransferase 2-like isoform X1 [Malus domestica]XP_028955102.1 GPI mannosyltransferase 2-like isoform X1 [Malus domestica]